MAPSPESFLPVKPLELLILAVLAEGELHGYRIRQAIVALTDGAMQIEAANLYRRIRKLEDDALVAESPRRGPAADDDPRRQYFRVTPLGRRVLAAEAARLRALVQFVERHA